jgi:peptide/nickel transport system substrate-binding protein
MAGHAMTRRDFLHLATVAAAGVAVPSSVVGAAQPSTLTPKKGGVFVVGRGRQPAFFDIDFLTSVFDIQINAVFYSGLLRLNHEGEVENDLATKWDWSSDGLKLNFQLVPQARFHDGSPLTSEDVVWSLNKMMGKAQGHARSIRLGLLADYITGITPEGPQSVTVHLGQPRPAIVLKLLATDFAGITKKGTTREMLAKAPHGAGPFVLKEVVKGSHVVAERNPNYHRPGLPYLDGIRFMTFANDQAGWIALATGKLDLFTTASALRPDMRETLEKAGLTIYLYSSDNANYLIFNLTRETPFKDKRVRQAVNLAFDRDAYRQAVQYGQSKLGTLWQQDAPVWGHSEAEIRQMPGFRTPKDADLAEAKRLMTEAGYPNGFDTIMETPEESDMVRSAEWIALELRKIGIRATVRIVSSQEWDTVLAVQKKYTFCMDSYTMTTDDPDEKLRGYLVTNAPRNNMGYSNPQLDRLAQQISKETDQARRVQFVRQVEKIMEDDMPRALVYERVRPFAFQPYVHNALPPFPKTTVYSGNRLDDAWLSK